LPFREASPAVAACCDEIFVRHHKIKGLVCEEESCFLAVSESCAAEKQ
jgi:hypothetical protein